MHRVTVNVRSKNGSFSNVAEFPPGEVEMLREFRGEVHRLEQMLLSIEFGGVSMHLRASVNQPFYSVVSSVLLDDVKRSAVLLRLRPFVHQQERCYLQKVANIICRRVENGKFREIIQRECDHFYGRRNSQGFMARAANGQQINSLETMMAWLNGFEYHRNEQKQRELMAIGGPHGLTLGLILNQLTDVIRAILNLGYLADGLLEPKDRPLDMTRFDSFVKG